GEHALPRRLLGELRDLRGRTERKGQLPLDPACPDRDRTRREPEPPEKLSPRPAEGVAGARGDERLEPRPVERRTLGEMDDAHESAVFISFGHERLRGLLPETFDVAEPDAYGVPLDPARRGAQIDIRRQH